LNAVYGHSCPYTVNYIHVNGVKKGAIWGAE